MDGKRFLNSVKFTNLLSFGPDGMELELQPLNVLIGPNGSGKSNFIDLISLLCSVSSDLRGFSLGNGIPSDWNYKGESFGVKKNTIEVDINGHKDNFKSIYSNAKMTHKIEFDTNGFRFGVNNEEIIYMSDSEEYSSILFKNELGDAKIVEPGVEFAEYIKDKKKYLVSVDENFKKDLSILSQDGVHQNQRGFTWLIQIYRAFKIFNRLSLGRDSIMRKPQDSALDSSFLFEDGSNLALVLNDIRNEPVVKREILKYLKMFYDSVVDYDVRIIGGAVQLYFEENGLDKTVPATRLSDGTIRYLAILSILLHPDPPPLICIEEPELGIHPDVISIIADLLIDASKRTQLIVTTHSDILLSAIGKTCPEAIVVCEKGLNGTKMTRPDPEQLNKWIEENFDLGSVWMSGLIGGTRW